jgi:hypothetical protein
LLVSAQKRHFAAKTFTQSFWDRPKKKATLREFSPDAEAHSFTILQKIDDLEEIIGPRIAARPEHAHEAL